MKARAAASLRGGEGGRGVVNLLQRLGSGGGEGCILLRADRPDCCICASFSLTSTPSMLPKSDATKDPRTSGDSLEDDVRLDREREEERDEQSIGEPALDLGSPQSTVLPFA